METQPAHAVASHAPDAIFEINLIDAHTIHLRQQQTIQTLSHKHKQPHPHTDTPTHKHTHKHTHTHTYTHIHTHTHTHTQITVRTSQDDVCPSNARVAPLRPVRPTR